MIEGKSKVLGPFEAVQAIAQDGVVLTSIPFSKVRGSQLIVSVSDNYASQFGDIVADVPTFWATVEVTLMGSVQGAEFVIKRQAVRMLTGPLYYIADDSEAYDNIVVRGRNVSGGSKAAVDFIASNGLSLLVQVQIQPRGGLGPNQRFVAG